MRKIKTRAPSLLTVILFFSVSCITQQTHSKKSGKVQEALTQKHEKLQLVGIVHHLENLQSLQRRNPDAIQMSLKQMQDKIQHAWEGDRIKGITIPQEISRSGLDEDIPVKFVKDESNFHFDDENEFAYLVFESNSAIVKSIPKNGKSVIRGSIEYKILKPDHQYTIVEATNLKPKFRSIDKIAEDFEGTNASFPKENFRFDPLVDEQQEVLKMFLNSDYKIESPNQQGILGKYQFTVTEKLGEGHTGEVFNVRFVKDDGSSFKLAIKKQSDIKTESVMNEVKVLEGMNKHPNSVFYIGTIKKIEDGNETFYIAMQPAYGTWESPGYLQNYEKTRAIIGAADSLAALHSAGMAHGDIKPDNIFIADNKTTWLGDYGSSRMDTGHDRFEEIYYLGLAMVQMRMLPEDFLKVRQVAPNMDALRKLFGQDWIWTNPNDGEMKLFLKMMSRDITITPSMEEVAKQLRQIHWIKDY